MKETLITFTTAILAKKKGFNLKAPCTCGGYPDCICEQVTLNIEKKDPDKAIYRPTQSLLQKWLLEVHDIFIVVIPEYSSRYKEKERKYSVHLYKFIKGLNVQVNTLRDELGNVCFFMNPENAIEFGLQEALKTI